MEKLQIYKCGVCGNVIEILDVGGGELVCCGQPMNLATENSTDAAQEKHVPVIERTETQVNVKVGSVAHPMEEKHYIQWIQRIRNGKACFKHLKPGDPPEASFSGKNENITVRAFCNIHGLWKA